MTNSWGWQLYGLVARALLVCSACVLFGCNEQIVHDLAEHDANRVVSRLNGAALQAQKVRQSDGRWAIEVPTNVIVPALAFLESNRVLITRASSVSAPKGGLVPSRQEQWFRYERAMALSIEESLGAITGVLEARVHLNLPESDPLFGTSAHGNASGSVLLLTDARYSASPEQVASLVGGAAGIPVSNVTVLTSVSRPPPDVAPRTGQKGEDAVVEVETREPDPSGPLAHYTATYTLVGVFAAGVVALAGLSTVQMHKIRRRVFQRLDKRDDEE